MDQDRGREGRLGVSPETLSLLAARGLPVVREKTDAALATYNQLAAEGRRVAGLFPHHLLAVSVEVVRCDHIKARLPA